MEDLVKFQQGGKEKIETLFDEGTLNEGLVEALIYHHVRRVGTRYLLKETHTRKFQFQSWMLIWGSIRCALATKIGGEAKAHEASNTQKWFGRILNSLGDIKIINTLMELLTPNHRDWVNNYK